jgi:hypothetical protein
LSRNVERFTSFGDFYPYYLAEHRNQTCRRLHFLGTSLVILALGVIVLTGSWLGLIALPVAGYGPAWAGHFFFEHNRPATFRYPAYSLAGDFVMYWHTLTGRLPF